MRGVQWEPHRRQDALGADGSVDLSDFISGADDERSARVGDGLAATCAGAVGARQRDALQVKLPVGAARDIHPAAVA